MNIKAIKLNPIELFRHLYVVGQTNHLLHIDVKVIHHLSEVLVTCSLSDLCDFILDLKLLKLMSHLSLVFLLVISHDCLFELCGECVESCLVDTFKKPIKRGGIQFEIVWSWSRRAGFSLLVGILDFDWITHLL